MLITEGVDSSRDSQGFLMNRQRFTNSLNLYGASPYVEIPKKTYDIDGSNVSFAFWAKRHDTSTHNLVLAGNANYKFINLHSNGNMYIESDTNDNLASAPIQTDTDWHHYAVICSSGTVAMYEDSVSLTMGDASISGDFTPTSIGFTTAKFFNGEIDDLTIYEGKALTAAEVKRNYNAGKRSHRNG